MPAGSGGRARAQAADCPDLLALGSPTYLTAATRKRLIRLRDRALAAAEAAAADQHARDTLRPRVDNLSP